MPNSHHELHETVSRLHAQLAGLKQIDPQVRAELETALDDILQALRSPGEGEPHTLAERLRSAAEHFQESHPAFFNTLGGVIDALGRMGI